MLGYARRSESCLGASRTPSGWRRWSTSRRAEERKRSGAAEDYLQPAPRGSPTAHGNHAPHDPAALPSPPPVAPRRPASKPGSASISPAPGRIASNFLSLSRTPRSPCRGTSVLVTLSLAKCLGKAGYGRIEFAFNIVFWLVLLVRNGCEVIAARELARHPRLVRPLVNHLFFIKIALAVILFLGLVIVGATTLSEPADRKLLALYGLMLLTTAMGLDFVYRGMERMGLVAISLYIRTAVYALGVWFWVGDTTRIAWVPAWLAAGEACGISLVLTRVTPGSSGFLDPGRS